MFEYGVEWDDVPDMALRNCHARGVDSIVLCATPEGKPVLRMFIAHPGSDLRRLLNPDGTFVVGIHNHRFNLSLTVLAGKLLNVEAKVLDVTGPSHIHPVLHKHRFSSAIRGDGGLEYLEPRYVSGRVRTLGPGDRVVMKADQLHTVVTPNASETTAWFVAEGDDVMESFLWSLVPLDSLDFTGLYDPIPRDEAIDIAKKVLKDLGT